MNKIKAAVIGVGYLGRFHAQKYAQIPACELVAVVDGREEVRNQVAAEVSALRSATTAICWARSTPSAS